VPDQLLPFLVVDGLLTLTPGPDMALVLRNGVAGGSRIAWWTGLGCCTGITVYAVTSALGLAALLAASATAFLVVKLAGAAYLVYLGVTTLWRSRRAAEQPVAPDARSPVLERRAAYRQGLLSNLLNPKIALLFLTLIPQFVSRDEPALATTAVLAVAFIGMAVLWWRVFSLAVGALGRVLARERVRTAIERLTGAVLIALGLRVAFSHG
jgi:threonine/homoserine/homoserine lactone efflux protein